MLAGFGSWGECVAAAEEDHLEKRRLDCAHTMERSVRPGCALIVGLIAGALDHVRNAWALIPVFLAISEFTPKPTLAGDKA
jgi:hypothetical protein